MPDSSHYQYTCSLCGNVQLNRTLQVPEQMYGTDELFKYLHCASCGVLHLLDPPADMGRFYPTQSYYSVHTSAISVRNWMRGLRDRLQAGESPVSRLIRARWPNVALDAMTLAAPRKDARILDVGCGDGALLRSMARLGFSNLTGADPLIGDSSVEDGIRLIKGGLDAVEGRFDLISFHHSLEHIRDQVGVLGQARQRLAPGGRVLIRIPTCDSLAFTVYGAKWVQLDAPRHLFLHSHRSIEHVAQAAGLAIVDLRCDSQPMQFWASEMYREGVPLVSPRLKEFKRRRLGLHRQLSSWLNRRLAGDQIVVTLSVPLA